MLKDNWNDIIKLLEVIKSKITADADLLWTSYNSAEEIMAEINEIDNLLRDKNKKGLALLEYLFAPTGFKRLLYRMHGVRNI